MLAPINARNAPRVLRGRVFHPIPTADPPAAPARIAAARIAEKAPFRRILWKTGYARHPGRENRPTLCFSRLFAGNGLWKAGQEHKDYYPSMRPFASQSARRCGPALSGKARRCKALPAAPQRRGRPSRQFFCKMKNGLSRSGKRANRLVCKPIFRSRKLNDRAKTQDGYPAVSRFGSAAPDKTRSFPSFRPEPPD